MTYIIAEAGVNHNGDINLALQLIDIAVDAGADAVKFQTFCTDGLVSIHAPKASYQKQGTDDAESQYEMLKKLELNDTQHFILKAYCEKCGITFLSTPFDSISAHFLLNQLKLKIIKIASGEITNAPLLLQIAKSNVDIILSTGMSTLGEIEQALAIIAFGYLQSSENPCISAFMKAYALCEMQKKLKEKVTLLHCTSNYPAEFNEINLRAMNTLKSAFGLRVGYSDHSMGISVPIAAVALGASIIEKHVTVSRMLPGPDQHASLEPPELKNMITAIREVEFALGNDLKIPMQSELEIKKIARKSLVASESIRQNDIFTEKNLSVRRPGHGISAMEYWNYVGKYSKQNYHAGEFICE